jgi:hypothetical protein
MKRLILLFTIVSLSFGIENLSAQKDLTFKISYNTDYSPRNYASKDIREFHEFQKDVIDFKNAINQENFKDPRRLKKIILTRMKNEIVDTRQKIRFIEREINYSKKSGLHKKGRRNNEYSKRKSSGINHKIKYLMVLEEQLKDQKRILRDLKRMPLRYRSGFYHQALNHLVLIKDFEAILKADIDYSFKQYRSRSRRNG